MRRTIDRDAERTPRQRLGYVRPDEATPEETPAAPPAAEPLGHAFAESKSGTVHAVDVLERDEHGAATAVADTTICGADVANMTTAPDATEPTCANCARKLAAEDGDS